MKSKMVGGMSFRDLAMLNDSLLAKQAWWLLNDKNSLFYRIFKALFFPQCTIMEAADSRSGSYPRKSILHGHDVILREQGGVLVMENPFKYGVTGGCLLNIHP